MQMQREDIENLRARVSCAVGLEQAGFTLDLKESTRRAVKYRRGAEIIIVTHQGKGWFDPLSDRKGDVFALIGWLHQGDFASTLAAVGALAGIAPSHTLWMPQSARRPKADIGSRWVARPLLRIGSPAHAYLSGGRAIPAWVLDLAGAAGLIRQGPAGSAWFAHHGDDGAVCGWEERGPSWRGFSSGGAKVLFRFGNPFGLRLCISEAAIDALSLSALEGHRRDTLYASTAGGWSPATERAVAALTEKRDLLVAATDRNSQGEAYADTLRRIAGRADCGFQRRCPVGDDWNDDLKQRREGQGG